MVLLIGSRQGLAISSFRKVCVAVSHSYQTYSSADGQQCAPDDFQMGFPNSKLYNCDRYNSQSLAVLLEDLLDPALDTTETHDKTLQARASQMLGAYLNNCNAHIWSG